MEEVFTLGGGDEVMCDDEDVVRYLICLICCVYWCCVDGSQDVGLGRREEGEKVVRQDGVQRRPGRSVDARLLASGTMKPAR